MSHSESDPRKFEMKAEHRLGKGKDGVVDTKTWERELKITCFKFFGKMALPIELGEYPDWAKPGEKIFIYYVNHPVLDSLTGVLADNFVDTPYPKPGDSNYDDFKEKKDDFRDLTKRWEDRGPQIIGLLLDGSMDAPTRVRLLQVIDSSSADSILTKIKRDIDPLRLIAEQRKIHYFTGNQADKDDKLKAEQLFRTFRETPIGHGVNVTEHKNNISGD